MSTNLVVKIPQPCGESILTVCQEAEVHLISLLKRAHTIFTGWHRPTLVLRFDKRGSAAGHADRHSINLNLHYLMEHHQDALHDTLPHELAHIVAHDIHHIWGHGFEWAATHFALTGGIIPQRCHQLGSSPHGTKRPPAYTLEDL